MEIIFAERRSQLAWRTESFTWFPVWLHEWLVYFILQAKTPEKWNYWSPRLFRSPEPLFLEVKVPEN